MAWLLHSGVMRAPDHDQMQHFKQCAASVEMAVEGECESHEAWWFASFLSSRGDSWQTCSSPDGTYLGDSTLSSWLPGGEASDSPALLKLDASPVRNSEQASTHDTF